MTRKTIDGKTLHTFQDKRMMAKMLIEGKTLKEVAFAFNTHITTVSDIRKKYVVITMTERYPDGEQGDLFDRDFRYRYKIPWQMRPRK